MGSPSSSAVFRYSNLALTLVWAAILPLSIVTGLWKSVAFISVISIYACFVSHLTAWRADVLVPNPVEREIADKVDRIDEAVD